MRLLFPHFTSRALLEAGLVGTHRLPTRLARDRDRRTDQARRNNRSTASSTYKW